MRENVSERFLFKGCFKGTEQRAVSLMFLYSELTNMSFRCFKTLSCQRKRMREVLSGGFVLF